MVFGFRKSTCFSTSQYGDLTKFALGQRRPLSLVICFLFLQLFISSAKALAMNCVQSGSVLYADATGGRYRRSLLAVEFFGFVSFQNLDYDLSFKSALSVARSFDNLLQTLVESLSVNRLSNQKNSLRFMISRE